MHFLKLSQQHSITVSGTGGGLYILRHCSPCGSLGTLDPSSLAGQVVSFQHVLRPTDQPHLTRATKAQDAICDQPLNSHPCLHSGLFEIISFISKRQVRFWEIVVRVKPSGPILTISFRAISKHLTHKEYPNFYEQQPWRKTCIST